MKPGQPGFETSRGELLAIAGVAGLASVVRWELLGTRSLWFDEGYSLFVARLGWPEILRFLRFNDAHPAGYYLILSWWLRTFGEDLAVLRLPSLLAGVGSVALVWALARRWFGPQGAFLAAVLVAANPFQVYASNELRMYMPLQLALLAATWALVRAVETDRSAWWACYGIFAAVAGYLSYFAAVAVAPQLGWAWLRYGRRVVRGLLVAVGTGLALYAPWLPYLEGFAERNPQLWTVRPRWHAANLAVHVAELLAPQTFGGYLPGTVTYHRTSTLLGPYLLPLAPFLVTGAVGSAWLWRRGTGGLAVATWLGGVCATVTASAAAGVLAGYPRNLVFLQPFAAVAVAAGAVRLAELVPGQARRLGVLCAGVILLAPLWLGLQNLQSGRPEFDAYRYDRAGRFVQGRFRPDDLVVYFPKGVEYAFRYYFRSPAASVSVAVPAGRWGRDDLSPLLSALRPYLLRHRGRVWVVTSVPKPALLPLLWRAVEGAGYRRVELRDFLGVQVALYAR